MSRTPSFGFPNTDCQAGFGYPAQVPLTTLGTEGVPVAQLLGPPLPPRILRRKKRPEGKWLQRLPMPNVEGNPRKLTIKLLAQESFQGISGM